MYDAYYYLPMQHGQHPSHKHTLTIIYKHGTYSVFFGIHLKYAHFPCMALQTYILNLYDDKSLIAATHPLSTCTQRCWINYNLAELKHKTACIISTSTSLSQQF